MDRPTDFIDTPIDNWLGCPNNNMASSDTRNVRDKLDSAPPSVIKLLEMKWFAHA